MFGFLIKGVSFIKKNPGLLFSLLLIIIIPSLVFSVVSFLAKSFQSQVDLTLQKQAMMAQDILSPYIFDYYNQPEILQEKIALLIETNPDLSKLRVFLPADGDNFRILASRLAEEKGEEISKTSLTLSWHKDEALAFLSREEGIRFWNIVRPFYNTKGEKMGLVSIALSLEEVDTLVTKKLQEAYIFVLCIILLILFLIVQHTRLFQYVDLFKKIRQTDKAKDTFMNMAVHELRSPVSNIKNYIFELKQEIFTSLNSQEQADINRVEFSVKRLNSLIDDVLDVIRIEQNRLSFEPEIIVPSENIREIAEELKIKADGKNLKIKLNFDNTQAKINANLNRFKEIIYNLIDNAIKYTQEGEINIIVKKDEKRHKLLITIADTGIGISAENQRNLFERFFRVKNRETADIQGTGLGLWIVKQLCSKMKGKILLESIKGVGSKFVLIFPLFEDVD
jgi:signal transduction histidine kinase